MQIFTVFVPSSVSKSVARNVFTLVSFFFFTPKCPFRAINEIKKSSTSSTSLSSRGASLEGGHLELSWALCHVKNIQRFFFSSPPPRSWPQQNMSAAGNEWLHQCQPNNGGGGAEEIHPHSGELESERLHRCIQGWDVNRNTRRWNAVQSTCFCILQEGSISQMVYNSGSLLSYLTNRILLWERASESSMKEEIGVINSNLLKQS